jgi:hypothetical protein
MSQSAAWLAVGTIMRKEILWILAALVVTALCLVNSYLETALMLQIIWYIGAAFGLLCAGFNIYEVWSRRRSTQRAAQPQEPPAAPPQPTEEQTKN